MPRGKKGFQKNNKLGAGKISWNRGLTWKEMFDEKTLVLMYEKAKLRTGNKNNMWKGDKASVGSIHDWMERHFGKPRKCENCGTIESKKYHWANKDHKYKRRRKDWLRLCVKCHSLYDKNYAKRERDKKGKFC